MARTIRVKRKALLDTLNKNRKEHIKVVNEAFAEWEKDMKKASKEFFLNIFDDVQFSKFSLVRARKPVSFEERYDFAIRQMEMETRTEIELEQNEFNQLVCDQWEWARDFTNNAYTSSVMSLRKSAK